MGVGTKMYGRWGLNIWEAGTKCMGVGTKMYGGWGLKCMGGGD